MELIYNNIKKQDIYYKKTVFSIEKTVFYINDKKINLIL